MSVHAYCVSMTDSFPVEYNNKLGEMKKQVFRCILCFIIWRRSIAFLTIQVDPKILQNGRRTQRIIIHVPDPVVGVWARARQRTAATKQDVGSDSKDDEKSLQDPKFIERNKRWIIVVDDEEPIRMAVGDFLYDQGYQVTACADADSMLKLVSSSNQDPDDGELSTLPDVIVSDIRMPGIDGIELLGLIRADERLARVPVVLLTAKGMAQDRVQGYKAGADVYLPKPFDPDELLSIIDNLITRRQQMSGKSGELMDLKEDMEKIKQIMKRNSATVVKKTDIFLTDTERDVLELLCKGFTNSEIADERSVSILGINRVIQKLYSKTTTRNRTELVRWAITTGYVSPRM